MARADAVAVMGDQSAIEWTEATWNPLVGCSRVSEGCRHCYAERQAFRAAAMGISRYDGITKKVGNEIRWTGEVRLVESALDLPLRWKKPRRIFVNSMSDLFHEAVADEWIDRIFAVMALATQHTFQVLTKRPERMLAYLSPGQFRDVRVIDAAGSLLNERSAVDIRAISWDLPGWPLQNVWLGVSVEDQATADERIPLLLQAPAAVRWVSYEPALAGVDFHLGRWVSLPRTVRSDLPFKDLWATPGIYRAESNQHGALSVRSTDGTLLGIKPDEFERLPDLDWLVVGGESGPGARPFDLAWARQTIAQGRAAGVPVFVKQLGAKPEHQGGPLLHPDGPTRIQHVLRDRKGGDPAEWPEDLRVREYPKGAST